MPKKLTTKLRIPKRREASIEQAFCRRAKARGWLTRKMNGAGFRDWPDRLVLPRADERFRTVMIEFKRGNEAPTPNQAELHTELLTRGVFVLITNDADEAVEFCAHYFGETV